MTFVDRAAAAARHLPAAREAVAGFPIDPVDLTPVWMSENITFQVTDGRDGAAYVLRLHRPGYHDLDALKAERVWTRALTAAGIDVPVGIRARDGDDFVPVQVDGRTRYAGLTRWTDGEVLAEVIEREGLTAAPARFRRLGAAIARLHAQSIAWTPPPGFRRHALDAEGLVGEAPWWGRFWESPALDPEEQARARAARDRLAGVLRSLDRGPEVYGLIHADLHPGNVLVAGDRLTVIDFDDAAFGWRAYDLAVAVFHYWDEPAFPALLDALLTGYRDVRPLDSAVEAAIPLFLLMRAFAVIGWLSQRPEIQAADYLPELKAAALTRTAAVFGEP